MKTRIKKVGRGIYQISFSKKKKKKGICQIYG